MLVALISGLATGGVYALVAVGYNLTWLTSKAVNFAHAAFIVTGMFFAVWLYRQHVPAALVVLILVVVGALVAGIEYAVAILPLRGRGDQGELVTTIGVTTTLQGIIYLASPQDVLQVHFFGPTGYVDLPGNQKVAPVDFILIAVAIVIALAAHFWSTRTRSGLAALAQSEDRDAALILGVRPGLFAAVGFVVSGALGFGLAVVVGPYTFAVVSVASTLAIMGFVVLAIGGLGSQLGALIGGLALGVVQGGVVLYASATWQNLVIYAVFIAVLLLRPQGIFGSARERAV